MNQDGSGESAVSNNQLTHSDVEQIIGLVEQSEIGYVHIESEGLNVSLTRAGYVPVEHVEHASSTSTAPPDRVGAASVVDEGPTVPAPAERAVVPANAPASDDSVPQGAAYGTIVASPMVGIFYSAPDPDSPPFVEVGQKVEADATVGIVEVMKMFTAVKADSAGMVAEILVQNGQAVTQGQGLIRIVEV